MPGRSSIRIDHLGEARKELSADEFLTIDEEVRCASSAKLAGNLLISAS